MADTQPIFGLSDEQIQALQQAAQQNQAAQVAQMGGQQGPSLYYRNLAGQGIGQAISGAMGYQDPMVQKNNLLRQAQQLTDVQARANGWAPMSPEYMNAGVQNLYKVGLPDAAMHAQQVSQDWASKNAATGMQVAETKKMNTDMQNSEAARKEWTDRVGENIPAGGITNPDGSVNVELTDKGFKDYMGRVAMVEQTSPWKENRQAAGDILKREKTGREHMPPIAQLGELMQDAIKSGDQNRIRIATDNYNAELKKMNSSGESHNPVFLAQEKLRNLEAKNRANIAGNGPPLTDMEKMEANDAKAFIEKSSMMIDPQTGKAFVNQPLSVSPGLTLFPGQTNNKDKLPTNALPSMEDGRKPIPTPEAKELNTLGSTALKINNLLTSLPNADNVFGQKFDTVGEVKRFVGRTVENSPYAPMAKWWSNYEDYIAEVRHGQYGSALTVNELENFLKYRARPSDSKEVGQANLNRQRQVLVDAMNRNIESMKAGGFNQKQAEALLGINLPQNPEVGALPRGPNIPNPAAPNQPALQNVSPTPVSPPPGASSISKAPAFQTPSSAVDVEGWKVWQEGNWIYRMNPQTGQLQKREVGK